MKKEVDFGRLLDGAVDAIAGLSAGEAVSLVVESLKGCTITAPNAAPLDINGASDVDAIFQGELDAMYEIVLESWKYNKLAPFKLAARFGFRTTPTATSGEAADTGTKHGQKLAL